MRSPSFRVLLSRRAHAEVGLICLGILLASCGKPGPEGRTEAAQIDWTRVSDDPSKTLEISWLGPLGFEKGRPGSWIQSRVEELFNVKLDPIFIDPVTFDKVLSLRFVAGDIPDVLWDGEPMRIRAKVRHGFVLELPYEVLLEHAPHYVAYVNAEAPETWMYCYWQGRNWGIPTVVPGGAIPLISAWRADWLENVGISKVPETLEEYHEAFRRFTFDDPDRNGLADTYGLSPSVAHWSYLFTEFFAQRNILPFDLQEVNGEITWGGIRPEAKEVLAMLRDWYAEGIIDPDFVLGSVNDSMLAFQNGKVGYYGLGTYDNTLNAAEPSALINRMAQLAPGIRLAAGPPPLGSDGRFHRRAWGGGGHVMQFSADIDPEKVLRVLRMLDTIYADPKLALELNMGRRGLHWDYSSEHGVRTLEPYKEKRAEGEMIGSGNFTGPSFFAPSGLPLDVVDALRSDGQREAVRLYSQPEWGLINSLGKTDVLASASDSLGDLRRIQEKYFVDIIRGKRPLSDFEEFVAEWKRQGGERLLAEANEFRRKRDEVWRKVGVVKKEAQ